MAAKRSSKKNSRRTPSRSASRSAIAPALEPAVASDDRFSDVSHLSAVDGSLPAVIGRPAGIESEFAVPTDRDGSPAVELNTPVQVPGADPELPAVVVEDGPVTKSVVPKTGPPVHNRNPFAAVRGRGTAKARSYAFRRS